MACTEACLAPPSPPPPSPQHQSEYKLLLTSPTSSTGVKRLAAGFVVKFSPLFPSLASQALDSLCDLLEDEDSAVRGGDRLSARGGGYLWVWSSAVSVGVVLCCQWVWSSAVSVGVVLCCVSGCGPLLCQWVWSSAV